ncbi:hypothetical protein [Terribacillus aidingensis]|nr:hypothetical protein [Terribacillus aidingensis]
MAEQFEFLYEEAAILDENGDIIGVDMNKVNAEYGYDPLTSSLAC